MLDKGIKFGNIGFNISYYEKYVHNMNILKINRLKIFYFFMSERKTAEKIMMKFIKVIV